MSYFLVHVITSPELGGVQEINLLANDNEDAIAQVLELGHPKEYIIHVSWIGADHTLEVYTQFMEGLLSNASIGVRLVVRQVMSLRRVATSFAQQTYQDYLDGKVHLGDFLK